MQDITRVSEAMDTLAKKILERRQQVRSPKEQEYERKVEHLEQVLDAVLRLQNRPDNAQYELDRKELDSTLENGLQMLERDGRKYLLVPLTECPEKVDEGNIDSDTQKKKSRKKKKNKIPCSFCHQTGHTRAHCQKRLLTDISSLKR